MCSTARSRQLAPPLLRVHRPRPGSRSAFSPRRSGLAYDINLAVTAGAADLIERAVVRVGGPVRRLPGAADGVIAAGGKISNLTALGRRARASPPGLPSPGADGRRGALYASDRGAPLRDARRPRCSGSARSTCARIPIDDGRRMRVDACARGDRRRPRRPASTPVAVVATAGTTLTGTVDRSRELADVCAARGVWLHVDGAYGLPAALDRDGRAALRRARAGRFGHGRRAQVAVRAQGLQRAPGARGGCRWRRPSRTTRPTCRTSPARSRRRRPHARVLAAAPLAEALAGLARARPRRVPRRDRAQPRAGRALLAELVDEQDELELLGEPAALGRRASGIRPPRTPLRSRTTRTSPPHSTPTVGCSSRAPSSTDVPCLRACFVNHRTTDADVRAIVEVVGEVAAGPALST